MTLSEAIRLLDEAGIDSPANDAREIFGEIGGIPPHLLALRDTKCDSPAVLDAVRRRAKGEPLQYIIGRVGFYREEYTVSPDCLIPREDTEILVDLAVKSLPIGGRFIDLCTGSGCIAISTLKNTKETTAVAVDVSEAALSLARKNAEDNQVSDRLSLIKLDLLNEGGELPRHGFDAVLSNPPYVSEEEYEALARELFHEPRIALSDGGDGSLFYRTLVPIAVELIRNDGFIAMEIGSGQAELLLGLAKENSLSCKIIKDFSGKDRVALLKKE